MRKIALNFARWADRVSTSHFARALLVVLLAGGSGFFTTVPSKLGVVASTVLAYTSIALAILILLSLLDDDLRVRRLAKLSLALADRLPLDGDHEAPADGLKSLEKSTSEIAELIDSIEDRLRHRHPVSGLPTREPLFEAMAGTEQGLLGVLHLLDLDRLFAFDEGLAENVLQTLSGRVLRMLGTAAIVAQVDRSRLAVWFGRDVAEEVADTKLQAVAYALEQVVTFDGRQIMPKVRVTSARSSLGYETPAQLLAVASVSTCEDGGADVRTGPVDPLKAAEELYVLEQDLRHAVARGELELAYQPLIDAQAGHACGAEALLRWRHPTRGMISPVRFVPIMEAAGLAGEIGLWALNTACREAQGWRRLAIGTLRVAVNISGHQLDGGDLVTLVERTLARHALTSDMLEIELTETIATGGADRIVALFADLRRLGVAVAIDDFGTGYSSFSTLRRLRFDKIKIDREFVTAVDQRRDSQAICRSILALGQGLGIRVLAEGVETVDEYLWLRAQGCRYFQGYYFAKPLDPHDFVAFVCDRPRLAGLIDPLHSSSPERLRA